MNLLLDEIDVLETTGDPTVVEVRGVEHDSRRVGPGDVFCCLPGSSVDGHEYAEEALANGAVGLLCEHLVASATDLRVVQARVGAGNVRPAMARLAAAFYGHPARDLLMTGVTGTNGKTTVTHLLGCVLEHAGRPTTVIGTLSGARTTPESTELQALLATARDEHHDDGSEPAVVMEVSSHALAQARVDGIHFDVAVFTNLSHDHLDFHGTMESYFEAKSSLFTPEHSVRGVVNADDRWGRRLLDSARIPLVAVSRLDAADITVAPGNTAFTWRDQRVVLSLTGLVNVDNALLAAEAAVSLGFAPTQIAAGLHAAPSVPGRLEVVAAPGAGRTPEFTVLVDYAHTPAGLEVALGEARRLTAPGGRVVTVFGCGGNRDRDKRPLMGAVAARLADIAVLTSDNPRDEDPLGIIEQVAAGVSGSMVTSSGTPLVIEPDRRAAISLAVDATHPGDVLVIAGKGHEDYQEVSGERIPFDDRLVVREELTARIDGDPDQWVPTVAGRQG